MKKFECIVKRGRTTAKIIRYFSDSIHAFAWLELEGYKVIGVKLCTVDSQSPGVVDNIPLRKWCNVEENPVT